MNNTFDFGRFSALIRRQWINFSKIYLMSLGIIAGIFVFFYGYYLWDAMKGNYTQDILGLLTFRPFVFIILGLLFITIVSSTYFSNLGDKSKAIFELLIPASSLEKFLASVFYTFILPVISYFFLFFVIDLGFVSYERQVFADFITSYTKEMSTVNKHNMEFIQYFFTIDFPKQLYLMSFLPVLLSSLFLLGSVYFSKFQFIKTAISLIAYVFVFIMLMVKIMQWATAGSITVNNNGYFDKENNVLTMVCIVGVVVTVIVWFIAYLRLKEKEV